MIGGEVFNNTPDILFLQLLCFTLICILIKSQVHKLVKVSKQWFQPQNDYDLKTLKIGLITETFLLIPIVPTPPSPSPYSHAYIMTSTFMDVYNLSAE